MTSRDVIVVLQRGQWRKTQRRVFPFARIADIILAAFWLAWLVAMMGGCSVNSDGLSADNIRGRIAVDSQVATSTDAANPSDAVPTNPDSGGMAGNSGSSPDGGMLNTPDVGGTLDAGASDTGNPMPPSACAFDPTRSLSPCNATQALCRTYDTPGHAVYQVDCVAEGYLCVAKCPT